MLYVLGYWVAVNVVVHTLLSGNSGVAPTQVLVDYIQTIMLIMPNNVVSLLFSLVNLQFPTGGVCWYERGDFGAFLQTLALAAISLVELALGYAVLCAVGVVVRRTGLPSVRRWLVRPGSSLLLAVYTPVTNAVFNVLNYRVVGPWRVLASAPVVLAEGAVYQPYFVASLLLLGLVTFGLPVCVLVLILRQWRRQRLERPEFRLAFGVLYERHKPQYPWWSVVVLLRRSVFAALLLVQDVTLRRYTVAVFALVMHLLQVILHPNQALVYNLAEDLATVSVVFVAVTLASASFFTGGYTADLEATIGVVIVVTGLVLGGMILYCVKDRLMQAARSLWQRLRTLCGGATETEPDAEAKTERIPFVAAAPVSEAQAMASVVNDHNEV